MRLWIGFGTFKICFIEIGEETEVTGSLQFSRPIAIKNLYQFKINLSNQIDEQ